jgi:hypothetical protein
MRHFAQYVPCIFENITYGCQLRSDEQPRRGLHDCLLLDYAGLDNILDDYCCAYLLILRLRGRTIQIGIPEVKRATELRYFAGP